jgi:molybdopterin-guanine dinucleotide biosynthesis protein A
MPERSSAITLGILAGGGGTRLGGRDKGLIAAGGQCLVDHVLARLGPSCRTQLISANRHTDNYAARNVAVLPDEVGAIPWPGPLAAVITLLRHTPTEWLQLAPCDAPLLPTDLPARLYQAATTTGMGIMVPLAASREQWACALINTDCRHELERLLHDGTRSLGGALGRLGYGTLDCSAHEEAFLNVNTPADLEELTARLHAAEGSRSR